MGADVDGGGTAETQVQGGEQQGGGAPAEAPNPVLERLAQFERSFGDRLDRIEQTTRQPAVPAQEPEEEPEEFYSPQYGPGDFDAEGSVTNEASMRELNRIVDERAARLVEQRLGPVEQRQEAARRAAEADALEARFPRLADPEVQRTVIDEAVRQAQRLGRIELAQEPSFIETIFLAGEARRLQQGGEPSGGQGAERPDVHMEHSRQPGAAGGEKPVEDVMGDAIVARAQQSRFRLGVGAGGGS